MNTTVMVNLDQPIQPTQSTSFMELVDHQGPMEQNPTQQHHSSSIELMDQSTSTLCNTSSIEVGSYVSTLVQETMSRSTSFMELPDYGSTSSMELMDHAFTSIDNNGMNIIISISSMELTDHGSTSVNNIGMDIITSTSSMEVVDDVSCLFL